MITDIAYYPGRQRDRQLLLNRYLPQLPDDVVASWLRDNIPVGSWVIDPFGAYPLLSIEAARAGYRVMVIAKNPVLRFLIELYSNPPTEAELQSTLASLSAARKGDDRLEPYILNQYITECDQCGQEISVEAFIWERDTSAPVASIYNCQSCKNKGEHNVTSGDVAHANRYSVEGIYQARALERIISISSSDHDRSHAEEAINAYLPRALHILITLINRLEGLTDPHSFDLNTDSSTHRHLAGMLLHALDKANTLWSYPIARERPRQLTIPPKFRENNIWFSLEEAIPLIASTDEPVPLTYFPSLPPESGGVVIFSGSLPELNDDLNLISTNGFKFNGVVTLYPRYNQAFWTLSTLWAGWLWGKEIIQQYKQTLRRRRYDWSWHTNAMHQVITHLPPILDENASFFGIISELEAGFLTSTLVASALSGFSTCGIAIRTDHEFAQITYKSSKLYTKSESLQHLPQTTTATIEQSSIDYIRKRAEPVDYINLHAIGLKTLLNSYDVSQLNLIPSDIYEKFQDILIGVFSNRNIFKRFDGSEKSLNIGKWWLTEEYLHKNQITPLSDKIENFIVQHLQKEVTCTITSLDKVVCDEFQGLFTPDFNLVNACINSYCENEVINNLRQIREQDLPDAREMDILSIIKSLIMMGESLHFTVEDDFPIIWCNPTNEVAYVFYILASATFGELISTNPYPASQSIIALPGGRAQLCTYKLKNNPLLRQQFECGWRFLKFRHIRSIASSPLIEWINFEEQLAIDPLSEADPQMRLL